MQASNPKITQLSDEDNKLNLTVYSIRVHSSKTFLISADSPMASLFLFTHLAILLKRNLFAFQGPQLADGGAETLVVVGHHRETSESDG